MTTELETLRTLAADVKADKVSVMAARDQYSVAVDPTSFTVDEAATARLRANPRRT